jgi:hypothetical protein
MRRNWTPSIVPGGHVQTVYLVADDFGRIGRAWTEADYEGTDLETVLQDLISGQYNNPIRVIAFQHRGAMVGRRFGSCLRNPAPLRSSVVRRAICCPGFCCNP